jgi:hypothetical protein
MIPFIIHSELVLVLLAYSCIIGILAGVVVYRLTRGAT